MPFSQPTEEDSPNQGHLGTPWEIAIAVIIVCLVAALVGAFIFQTRRKRREMQQRAREQEDLEKGKRRRPKDCTTYGRGREKRPDSTDSRDPEKRGDSTLSNDIVIDESRIDVEEKATGSPDGSEELTKPPLVAQTKRHSKSSYHEYIAKKPPRYYWDQQ